MTENKLLIKSLVILLVFSIPTSFAQTGHDAETQMDTSIQESETISIQSCKCVAFRLDDIQGFWLNNAQIAVIDEFHNNKIPLTIGIISGEKFQFGKDSKITDYVQNLITENSTINIANHGWIHENFTDFDEKTQSEILKKSNERLFKILGVTPNVFIPPFNEYNENTIRALLENKFTHFSPSLITSSPPYLLDDADLQKYPVTSSTGEIGESGLFEGVHHKVTMKDIQTGLNSFGFAAVMMHPQEFSIIGDEGYTNVVNEHQILELKLLIDDIEEAGLEIVLLEEIGEHVQSYELIVPKWFQKVLQWKNGEKISNMEFSEMVEHLKKQGVIKLSK